MRRTLGLVGLVVVGIALLVLVPAPHRPTGPEQVHGHRVFGVKAREVRRLELFAGEHVVRARRTADTWEVEGRPMDAPLAAALDDLVGLLAGLRAVDVFRATNVRPFGLDRPRAVIVVETARRTRRVRLGEMSAGGTTLYAQREGQPRVARVGTQFLSALEHVLYRYDHPQ